MSKEIEINGIKYQQIEQAAKKPMGKMAMMMLALGGMDYKSSNPKQRPMVDIEKEFELIQLKQSKLSRNDREWVVYSFNKLYKQI